ncbi:hypothetical protein GYMLUDRAFT_159613, partial [Collybiopsis luxurians FD-317 M1]
METIYEFSRSPYGIPEQRIPDIRRCLESVNQDLDDYNNEISRLENQLVFLRTRYERAQKKAVALRSLLAPVHCLPNELLTQIFDYVCDNSSPHSGYQLSEAPFRLSAVCSRWRSLCLSHSKMWAKIAVNCGKRSMKLGDAVDLYLERSKPRLLSLQLLNDPTDQDGHNVLLQKLVNCCTRWRYLTL